MAELVRDRCGDRFSARTAMMVGDRWSTDGEFGRALGCPFALVRSGVTPIGAEVGGEPTIDCLDLAEVASRILAG
jgi:ribonucleotide monophosphatase NagD (HAD superfamily)